MECCHAAVEMVRRTDYRQTVAKRQLAEKALEAAGATRADAGQDARMNADDAATATAAADDAADDVDARAATTNGMRSG